MSKPAFSDLSEIVATSDFDMEAIYAALDSQESEPLDVTEREGEAFDKFLDFVNATHTPSGTLTAIFAATAVLAPWKFGGKSAARMAAEAGITKQCLQQSIKRFNEQTGIRGRLQRSKESCEKMRQGHQRRKKDAAPAKTTAPRTDYKGAAGISTEVNP
jgi:hypothetical protein